MKKEKEKERMREKADEIVKFISFLFPFQLIFDADIGGREKGEKKKEKRKTKFRQSAEYINININGLTRVEKGEKKCERINFVVEVVGWMGNCLGNSFFFHSLEYFYYFPCNSIKELSE